MVVVIIIRRGFQCDDSPLVLSLSRTEDGQSGVMSIASTGVVYRESAQLLDNQPPTDISVPVHSTGSYQQKMHLIVLVSLNLFLTASIRTSCSSFHTRQRSIAY